MNAINKWEVRAMRGNQGTESQYEKMVDWQRWGSFSAYVYVCLCGCMVDFTRTGVGYRKIAATVNDSCLTSSQRYVLLGYCKCVWASVYVWVYYFVKIYVFMRLNVCKRKLQRRAVTVEVRGLVLAVWTLGVRKQEDNKNDSQTR